MHKTLVFRLQFQLVSLQVYIQDLSYIHLSKTNSIFSSYRSSARCRVFLLHRINFLYLLYEKSYQLFDSMSKRCIIYTYLYLMVILHVSYSSCYLAQRQRSNRNTKHHMTCHMRYFPTLDTSCRQ
mgnify:CR=1 FL=1